ncbi:nucleotidyltransferase [Cytobacillus sp. IB215665]|uniref:nucleotidyltransferase n=1 Tax=Cytobacillus sp. IB215665 TaxID=3097357 RepID=UPI002A17BCAC|nr:nucleotidyltransferase [Cytobacillus sp. IB215665]MDX8364951.1 nucleotidyltransferase [Cytobacillus sp. IB215665]
MKAAGVIVEYNPFHNGHYVHLQETKKQTGTDCVVAVMSGNFLQRGEPALVSKWARTKMALEAGVDIVVELPYAYASQNAEMFANGAISILSALLCEEVCFGSEHGEIKDFQHAAQFLKQAAPTYNEKVKNAIDKGYSYPKASSIAFNEIKTTNVKLDLSKPNNILGYHYVKAIHDQHSNLTPLTITRTGAQYHDEEFTSPSIASATSIRQTLFSKSGNLNDIHNYIPVSTKNHLINYYHQYDRFHSWEAYFPLLKYKLLTSSLAELESTYECEEGLEYRLMKYIKESTSFITFMEKIKTKRYTWTRLQRLCLHIITNTKKDDLQQLSTQSPYIRLLGMNMRGQQYLNEVKKKIQLPIISKAASFEDPLFMLDITAAHVYASILPEPLCSTAIKQEYSTPPIRFDEDTRKFK